VSDLLAGLARAATVGADGARWAESKPGPWPPRSAVQTTAVALGALARLQPEHPLVPAALRWLLVARGAGGWGNRLETAQALLALADYLASCRGACAAQLAPDYRWSLALDGRVLEQGRVDATNQTETRRVTVPIGSLGPGEHRIELRRSDPDPGQLYYAVRLRSYPPAEELPARSNGLSISREYLPVAEGTEGTPLASARAGQLVRVKLTVVAPTDLHYVVVEDPLPAGFEPADLSATLRAAGAAPEEPPLPFGGGWRRPVWSHVRLADGQVILAASYLPRGAHQYSYLAQAQVVGEYRVLPARAYQQYASDIAARTDGQRFRIEP
jgi:uncharacterized protein YfaS (alpha-2-macroglobulin family)